MPFFVGIRVAETVLSPLGVRFSCEQLLKRVASWTDIHIHLSVHVPSSQARLSDSAIVYFHQQRGRLYRFI